MTTVWDSSPSALTVSCGFPAIALTSLGPGLKLKSILQSLLCLCKEVCGAIWLYINFNDRGGALRRPVSCCRQSGTQPLSARRDSGLRHPSSSAVTCCNMLCPGQNITASQTWGTWQLCCLGGSQEEKRHYQDWSGAEQLLQPPRRHSRLLVSPRGFCLKGSEGLLRRVLRVPSLGVIIPTEKVWSCWGMPWKGWKQD